MRLSQQINHRLAAGLLGAALALTSATAMAGPRPVVLELFTSNGCSSCPPAYTLLRALRDDPPADDVELILLNEHVDYWDKLGWVDPLSDAAFTARQRDYANHAFASRTIYTPQLVVDGVHPMVGSRRAEVEAAIRRQANRPSVALTLALSREDANTLDVSVEVDSGEIKGAFDIRVALTQDDVVTQVGGGENGGRALVEDGVVRRWSNAQATGPGRFHARIEMPADLSAGDAAVVVFIQRKPSWQIVGATRASLAGAAAANSAVAGTELAAR